MLPAGPAGNDAQGHRIPGRVRQQNLFQTLIVDPHRPSPGRPEPAGDDGDIEIACGVQDEVEGCSSLCHGWLPAPWRADSRGVRFRAAMYPYPPRRSIMTLLTGCTQWQQGASEPLNG